MRRAGHALVGEYPIDRGKIPQRPHFEECRRR
jgi:hypothetical protein